MRTALLIGATGLVGGHVLELLLASPEYGKVHVLVRRASGASHGKLEERVIDFAALGPEAGRAPCDDVYICLGTTIRAAGSQERFREVDHDYVLAAASASRTAGATRLALVSSVGASTRASSFYLRVKGEAERDVAALDFPCVTVARPSLLVGARREQRAGEAAAMALAKPLSFALIGALRTYKPIDARTVAAALVRATLDGAQGTHILHYGELTELAARLAHLDLAP
jgi:uncharacterized protein YbjT (DUF2867 family)